MATMNVHKDDEIISPENDFKSNEDQFMTDDEDDSNIEGISNLDSGNACYQRRGRRAAKFPSKSIKLGHSRTKSEGNYIFRGEENDIYGQGNFTDNLANVELLSNCQNSRRRVQSASRDRDLSPSEMVRQYITKEKEEMDLMIGRLVHNVEDMAEVAAKKVSVIQYVRSFP